MAASAHERVCTLEKKSGTSDANWALTDLAPGANDVLLTMKPVRPERRHKKLPNKSMGGEVAQAGMQNAGRTVEFGVSTYLHGNNWTEYLALAMALGTSSGVTTPGGGTLSRDQALSLAPSIDGIVATFCEGPTSTFAATQASASVVPSCMAKGFKLSGSGDGEIMLDVDFVGIDAFRVPQPTGDGLPSGLTLNATRALIAAATNVATGRRFTMQDLELHLDVNTGGDDFSSVETYVKRVAAFTLECQRDMTYPEFGSQSASALDAASRAIMPRTKSMIVPRLTLTLDRWADDVDWGRMAANTAMRCRLAFVGDLIEGSLYERLWVDLPLLEPLDDVMDKGEGNVGLTLTYEAKTASSTPTGFSSTNALRMATRTKQTANWLA